MSENNARKRPIRVVFRLAEDEAVLLEQKMAAAGIQNREAYIRKMILDGHVLRLDFSDIKRMVWLLSNATNNLNQLAKRANEERSVAVADVQAIRAEIEPLWGELRAVLKRLANL